MWSSSNPNVNIVLRLRVPQWPPGGVPSGHGPRRRDESPRRTRILCLHDR